jgi:hypothetical protein
VNQVAWMLDYLDDIASDLSAFHRIDDATALDGPTFLKLAWRLPAYTGVMQSRALAEQNKASRSEGSQWACPRRRSDQSRDADHADGGAGVCWRFQLRMTGRGRG